MIKIKHQLIKIRDKIPFQPVGFFRLKKRFVLKSEKVIEIKNIKLINIKEKENKMINQIKNKIFNRTKSFQLVYLILFFSFISFSYNINIVSAADTTPPAVNITYSSNPTKTGTETITATYSESIVGAPTISINQPGSTDISNAAMVAPGGTVWTNQTTSVANTWRSVAYGNGIFVAISTSGVGNRVMTSPDGINWTARTSAADNGWYTVAFGNGVFVAVSSDGTNRVMTSPDGITWTLRNASLVNTWLGVTYGGGLFAAVSGDGSIMTSPDGITWTTRFTGGNSMYAITYGGGLFVAVSVTGTGNRVITSPDGITWTYRTSAADNDWYAITYGNGLFVAVAGTGTGNRVMTSPNGITWTIRTSAADNTWRGVGYGNGLFVAVSVTGTGNRVMTSPNGVTWTARTGIADNNWYGVAYGNGIFVVAAANGTNRIMTSPMNVFNYNYTVNATNGTTYIDGTATVSLSSINDLAGNAATAPTNNTFTIDTVSPTVALTYSSNPANVGTETITATYSEPISSAPNISINQPGSTDISNVAMSGSGAVYTYDYAVTAVTGGTYIDGDAIVSLSATTDLAGNTSSDPTNNTFTMDTTTPTVALTYSKNPTGAGTETITATYSESITSTPNISINQPGSTDISSVAMTQSTPGGVWTSRTTPEANTWNSITYGNGIFVAVSSDGTNKVMTSPDGITWTARAAAGTTGWTSIVYGNGMFVAVTSNFITPVMTSPDGINWTTRSATGVALGSVTYGNGLFVAIPSGTSSAVITSPDGITWTARTGISASWSNITYGNGLFVAIAGYGNIAMSSPDGINWTARTLSATFTWQSIAYGNGTFVAVASDIARATTSPDGINWTTRTTATSNTWYSVTYGGGLFVAVGQSGANRVMTSPDGITWTARTAAALNIWQSVAYGNGLFVAVSYDGTNRIMTSPISGYTYTYTVNTANGTTYVDGIANVSLSSTTDSVGNTSATPTNNTFTIDTTTPAVLLTYSSNPAKAGTETITATYSKSITSIPNISINQPGTTDISNVAMSQNPAASVWTAQTVPTASLNTWHSVTYGNGIFVAVSTDGTNRVMTSPDGTTWTERTAAQANLWQSVTYGNGLFVAVSSNGTNRVMTSPDGITWTPRSAAAARGWYSVTYGNGLFVAVASDGLTTGIMTSPDGITWNTRTAPVGNVWQAVTYGNGLFVIVSADGGPVLTSPDGITWTQRTTAVGQWTSVAYGGGIFAAVGYAGSNRVMTSPDGITWTSRSASLYSWQNITYANGFFVAVAANGTGVMTSPNGITWTDQYPPQASWFSVAYGNGTFVVVGYDSSRVITSSSNLFFYNYIVNAANGTTYVDGTATVSLSATTDSVGNISPAPVNNTFTIDTTGPTVALSYSKNIAGAGLNTITATYSEPITSIPNISINQPGSTDIDTVAMSGSGAVYTYAYTVNVANGTTYIDGTATVSLSATADGAGNTSAAPASNTFTIDTTGPTVALTYSKNPTGSGVETITATYSKSITSTPNISINQPGTTDVTNVAMTGSGAVYTYAYTVNAATGGTYVDGTATVSLSATIDSAGNTSAAPTNNTFTIDTTRPTAAVTYSLSRAVKSGDSLVITATFNKAMADAPIPQISISGVNTLSATNMTKVDATHYNYTYTVGAGNGNATVALSTGTDLAGNIIVSAPTSGATFTLDNILPSVTITAVCSVAGNGCTTLGQAASPQQSFSVQSLTGTASDDNALSLIQISIKDTNTGKWYSGTSFVDSTETYLNATGTTSWSFNSSAVSLTINDIYTINVKALDAALNPQVQSLTFQFTNSPPVVSNVTATQDSNGQINVTYDVTDIESAQTTNYLFYGINATLNGNINNAVATLAVSNSTFLPASGNIIIDDEIISYTSKTGNTLNGLTRGSLSTASLAHTTGTAVYLQANSITGTGVGLSNKGNGKIIAWTAKSDVDGYENLNEIIRVVANDGSTGSMIGSLESTPFPLDVKTPDAVVTFDAGIAGVTNSATITIPMPVDQSIVEYKISDDAATETNPTTSDWKVITQNTTILWTFDSDIEAKTIKYQYRDNLGNIGTQNIISTKAPVPASSMFVQDASNISIPVYDMYIGWAAADAAGFASYKLEYATSSDNVTFGSYTTIVGGGMDSAATNYYLHRLLNPALFYKYRLAVVGTNGNTSVRAGSSITAKPDGIQNYGEGTGSGDQADTVKPTITLLGSGTISLTVGDTYTDAGATASDTYNNITTDLTSSITVVGIPNSPVTEGSYTIMYTVSDAAGNTATATRTVDVTFANTYDITATAGANGAITPTGVTSVTAHSNQTYTITPDVGYAVNVLTVDGVALASAATHTFTDVVSAHTINVTFTATPDKTAPVVTILGDNPMNVILGSVFTDPGATAVDDIDGDLTSSIVAKGIVNANAVKTYTITYIVSDAAKNKTTATRTVVVKYADAYDITSTAGTNGTITPVGVTSVATTTDQVYTITPDDKYKIASLVVDGVSLAADTSFTFTHVIAPHTIDVTFSPIDTLPPVITVLGDNPMSINTGTVFTDPGATAVTAVTGDSVNVITTGTVNTSIGGENTITYTATDSYGNVAIATRTVNVVDVTPPVISKIGTPVVTSNQVAIVWETDEPADGKIMYGTVSGTYDNQTTLINTLLKNHLVAISDLKAITDYYYVIVSADKNGNVTTTPEQTFKTITVEQVYVSAGGGMMGVAQSVYDALLAQNENYKSKFGTDVSIPSINNIKTYDITPFSATVSFDTSKDTIAFINYGKDIKYGQIAADDTSSKNHVIKISGLTLGTDYNYKIKVMDKLDNTGYSDNQTFSTKFLTEDLADLKKIDNVQQFQAEIESTIESILPSLVPPFIDKPTISDITENSATVNFRTNIKAYPVVSYTTDGNYDAKKDNPYDGEMSDTSGKDLTHTLFLIGLKPNTKYHVMAKAYSLPQVVGKSDDITFITAASKIKASIINVKTDSFTVVWSTDELTSSVVEYKNIKTGIISRVVDDTKNSSHSVKIENLPSGTSYQVNVSGVNKEGNTVEGGSSISVKTSIDITPPVISNVKVDNTLIVGQTNRVQTIISWQTDKPSTSTIYYEEGSGASDKGLANKQDDPELAKNHAVILTVFKPGTIYRFTISSTDSAGNISKLPIRTIITPQKGESIMDIIFKNFDQTFNFINNVK